MSLPEIVFRAKQYLFKLTDKRNVNAVCEVVLKNYPTKLLHTLSTATNYPKVYKIFDRQINIDEPIEWHLDINNNRYFPLIYAKDIDIRTEKYGSAKYVWEVNRLQFLPNMCLEYQISKKEEILSKFIAINKSWIDNNPYLLGVNWYSSIEVSLRLINWFVCWNILSISEKIEQDTVLKNFVEKQWIPCIYQHCLYVVQNPSYYSSANNHLIAEYAGLFIATSFWQFEESPKWNAFAKKGLEQEIQRQHNEGINREQAAEYIQFITDFFLITQVVADKTNNSFSAAYRQTFEAICQYIADFLDCRDNYPKYGDEDDGIVFSLFSEDHFNNFRSILTSAIVLFNQPKFKHTTSYWDTKNQLLFGQTGKQQFEAIPINSTPQQSSFYPAQGHFILRKQYTNQEVFVHFNAAPLGYLSIAAHGHADALSFTIHLDGHPFLIDPGTFTYHTLPKWRDYFVSTRAHNTLNIDASNQALHAGGLLWANHYKCNVLAYYTNNNSDFVRATHNGYQHIGCQHERTLIFDKTEEIIYINDIVTNHTKQNHVIEVCFHFHPFITITQQSTNEYQLTHQLTFKRIILKIDSLLTCQIHTAEQEPIMGWYSESFKKKMPTTCITATIESDKTIELRTEILLSTLDSSSS